MRLAKPIPLRLSVEKKAFYEIQAAAAEKHLSTYLRERLESEDAVLDELSMLRRAVERITDRQTNEPQGGGSLPEVTGMLLEMLLTLRQIAGSKSNMAQSEIKRQGYDVWRSEK